MSEYNHPKGKLTRTQYIDLDNQYARTPSLSDSFMPSGEHYILMGMLNSWGFYPHSREESMDLAQELLSRGWKDE
jgi:hypothetical protein